MKKTSVLLLLAAGVLAIVWLLRKPERPTSTEVAFPTPNEATARQQVPVLPTRTVESSSLRTKPEADTSNSSSQSWIDARSAPITIAQAIDTASDEPIGTIRVGSASGTLGETPPFYRLQLKTAKYPILIGEKNTRHHFVRKVDGVHAVGNEVTLVPEIAISYPRSASLGGIVFRTHEEQITQLGVIVPEIHVPAGDDPSSAQWSMSIRIGTRELNAEDFAKAMPQQMGPDTVLVMPTHRDPPPATARVLWLTLDASGSFVVARN